MAEAQFDVVGIGNAIVDVIANVGDDDLTRRDLVKGSMHLIDAAQAEILYAGLGPTVEMSGGSAANTIAGLASLGANAGFVGKVAEDQLGRIFAHDIRSLDVTYETPILVAGEPTGRCMVMVTPDGERTMNTFLGAAQALGPDDVDPDIVAAAKILYLEGYLWDPPAAKDAFVKAADIARGAGREVALSLSDSFCVDRFRDEFLALMRDGKVTICFANESEIHSLYETADTDTALEAFSRDVPLGVVTLSEKGAVVVRRDTQIAVPAHEVERIVDLTGAGDLFAAGFLHALAHGKDAEHCARLGALCAAEVIAHLGARPQVRLADLAAENGLGV